MPGAAERPTGSGGRAPGLSGPASPQMPRAFVPHSGALSSSPAQQPDLRPAQPGGARAPPTCPRSSPRSALWGPGPDGRGSHLAKLAFSCLSGAVLGSLSQGEDSPPFPKCLPPPAPPFFRPWAPRPREAKTPALGGTARLGRIKMQTPGPGTCPALAQPHICPRRAGGWWGDLVPGGRGWGGRLDGPLHHRPPPQAPQPGSIHQAAQLPAHPPRPRHQSTPGPLLPLSFLPSSSLPNSSLFFFFSPLSLPTCHYSRNKKRGDNAGIDGSPLPAPSPRGACQHSFHPPRAGTAAKGAVLINKRNQINQEHNRGICCT